MTVRVNKSSFNIREKLSELGRKFGLKGSELVAAETAQEAGSLLGVGRKNLIINGNQDIDQRNNGSATANFSGSGHFVTDRWEGYNQNGGTISGQRVEDAPPGFKRSLKLTVGTASSPRPANAYGGMYYTVEGFDAYRFAWGTSGAKFATLSFWTKASVAGLYTVAVRDNAFNAYYIATYYIDSVNTWEYKTVTIPPTTSGSFGAGNGIGFSLFFAFDTGSNAHGTAVNSWVVGGGNKYATSGMAPLFATSGNTWQITGVQMEVGKIATEFEYRSYGEELSLCQRYYGKIRLSNQEWIYNESNSTWGKWWMGYIPFSMRINPNIDSTDLTGGVSVSGLSGTVSTITPQTPGDTPGRVSMRVTMSQTTGNAYGMYHTDGWAGDYMAFDAEF